MKPFLLIIGFFVCALWVALIGDVSPLGDDWTYLTSPHTGCSWQVLLPSAAWWRPFDGLWGWMMANAPQCFPWANRVAVAIAHLLNAVMMYSALRKFEKLGSLERDSFGVALGTSFFAFSSAAVAVLVNPDSINQAWSFFFGMCALNVYLGNEGWKALAKALPLVFISMLFKESGVSWLGVLALVAGFRFQDSGFKFRAIVRVGLIGAGVLVIYFALRFGLKGGVALGGSGDYAMGFHPVKFCVDLLTAVVPSLTAIDLLALFTGKYAIFGLTVLLSIVFWGLVGWFQVSSCRVQEFCLKVLFCGCIAVVLALPHCFFKNLHPAEMHFYPVLFAGALFIAMGDYGSFGRRLRIALVGTMIVLFAIGWIDKLSEFFAYSARTSALMVDLKAKKLDFAKSVYLVVEDDPAVRHYSCFAQSAAHGIYFGAALRSLNSWRDVEYHPVSTSAEFEKIPNGAQVVRIK